MYKHRSVQLCDMRKLVPHKLKEPNPLNLFEIRKCKVISPYFEYISIPYTYNLEDSLNKWILKNLKGRYFVGKTVDVLPQTNKVETLMKVGFEDSKEMSYFMLACPLLKYK